MYPAIQKKRDIIANFVIAYEYLILCIKYSYKQFFKV